MQYQHHIMGSVNNDKQISLESSIEALLFYSGEELEEAELATLLKVERNALNEALSQLERNLESRGLVLLRRNGRVQMGTHPDVATLIEEFREKRFSQNLGKAALETLTIILYDGPVTKADIDYLRGVNSATTLRQLRGRGLVDKVECPEKGKRNCYQATGDTLRHLGISSPDELPHFKEAQDDMQSVHEFKQDHSVEVVE